MKTVSAKQHLMADEGGFTLPELLVTIMMMTLVMFSLYSIFDMGLRVFAYGNDEVEAVENARVGLERMEREIRAAYPVDKTGTPSKDHLFFSATGPGSASTAAMPTSPQQITFGNELGTPDNKITCDVPASCEYVTYKLAGSTLVRNNTATGSSSSAGDQPLVEGVVENLRFTYLKSVAPDVTAASESEINVVRISLSVRVEGGEQDGTQTLTTDVKLRNSDLASTTAPAADSDGDGLADGVDNCAAVPNPDQADQDSDNLGNACDDDRDGDGFLNDGEQCPDEPYPSPGDGCPPTQISVNDKSVAEGNTGTTTLQFIVTRSGKLDRTTTVNYATADASPVSAAAGSDYTATSGTVTFAPGITTQTVDVTVIGDTAVESSETFNLLLSSPSGGTISGSGIGVGTITNDDIPPALPTLSVNDVTAVEGNTGTKSFTFIVTRTGDRSRTASVNYATGGGDATPGTTSGTDYTAVSGTLNFAVNEATQTVTVQVRGDTTFENNETFNLVLSNPTNATISDDTGVGTIDNDDPVPPQCSDGIDNGPRPDGKIDFSADRGCTSTTDNSENQKPSAVADTYPFRKNSSVPLQVLTNDSDLDGDPRTVITSGTLRYTSPRDSGGTIRGTVTLNANGSGTYTPPNGFEGTVTFTYSISDGKDATDTATVTIAN